MWTLGSRRIVIRGNAKDSSPNLKLSKEILKYHYKFSGHTHIKDFDLIPSDYDRSTLKILNQSQSSIYVPTGKYSVYYAKE